MAGGVPKSSCVFSMWGSFRGRAADKYALPRHIRPAAARRGSGTIKFRKRAGNDAVGGATSKHPFVRCLVGSMISTRVLMLALLTFTFLPSLLFFEPVEHPLKELDSRRLAESQPFAVDMIPGSLRQLDPKDKEQKQQQKQDQRQQEQEQHQQRHEQHQRQEEQHQRQQEQEQRQKQHRQQQQDGDKLPAISGEGKAGNTSKEQPKATTIPPWQPPALPVEIFRDVPPEECLPSPLWKQRVDPSEYEFGCKEIEAMLAGEKTLIGNGVIRDVYLVDQGGRKLVLKVLREDYELLASKSWTEKIHRWEAAALDAVRGHPHVVGLLGLCESSSVSEFFEFRLDDLVLKPGAKPLPMTSVVSMALDAARGLQALHEAKGGAIIHFDIKPQQMMLDPEGRLKINDLNMCKFAAADVDGNTCPFESPASNPGPFRSPENIAGEPLTEKLDVYSLAMTYYTMLNLKPPYTGEPGARDRIVNGIPPAVDPSWHPGFMEIVQDMWQRDPKARPSAGRVADRLEILLAQMMQDAKE